MQLEQKEYEEKRRVKRYNERKKREAFRSLLIDYENSNTLIYKTKWKNFVQIIKDDPRFLDMVNLKIKFKNKIIINFLIKTKK